MCLLRMLVRIRLSRVLRLFLRWLLRDRIATVWLRERRLLARRLRRRMRSRPRRLGRGVVLLRIRVRVLRMELLCLLHLELRMLLRFLHALLELALVNLDLRVELLRRLLELCARRRNGPCASRPSGLATSRTSS